MLIAETPIEIRAHSDAEVDAILAELQQKQTSRPCCSSYWDLEIQIFAGLRCGEIPPLEWNMEADGETYAVVGSDPYALSCAVSDMCYNLSGELGREKAGSAKIATEEAEV